MITMDMIDFDCDIDDLCVFESALAHEIKHLGVVEFVAKYASLLDELRESWNKYEFCLLLGYLEYYDPSFSYDETVKLDKYVLDIYDFLAVKNDCKEEINLKESWDSALPSFKKRGFLNSEVEVAV